MILAIDWLLDRVRTVVNLMGDAFGCVVVDDLMRRHRQRVDGTAHDGKQIPYVQLQLGEQGLRDGAAHTVSHDLEAASRDHIGEESSGLSPAILPAIQQHPALHSRGAHSGAR